MKRSTSEFVKTLSPKDANFGESEAKIRKDLEEVKIKFGIEIDDSEILILDASGMPDMAKMMSRLQNAMKKAEELKKSEHQKSPQEVLQNLQEVASEQKHFVYAMMLTRQHNLQNIVAKNSEMELGSQTDEGPALVPQQKAELDILIKKVQEMPSCKDFENRIEEIEKTVESLDFGYAIAGATQAKKTELGAERSDHIKLRASTSLISQAFTDNIEPFAVFISNQAQGTSAEPSKLKEFSGREAIISNIKQVAQEHTASQGDLEKIKAEQKSLQSQIDKVEADKAKALSDKAKDQSGRVKSATEEGGAKDESEAKSKADKDVAEAEAKFKEAESKKDSIVADKTKAEEELKKAKEKFDELKKKSAEKKPFWKVALTTITFGAYSGGKKEDPKKLKEAENQILALENKVLKFEMEVLKSRDAERALEIATKNREIVLQKFKIKDLQTGFGIQNSEIESKDQAKDSESKIREADLRKQLLDVDSKLKSVTENISKAKELEARVSSGAGVLEEAGEERYRPSIVARNFANSVKKGADELELSAPVLNASQKQSQREGAQKTKETIFKSAINKGLSDLFAVSEAVKRGDVEMGANNLETGLSYFQSAASLIPVFGNAAGTIASIGQTVSRIARTRDNTNSADFALSDSVKDGSDLRNAIVAKISDQLTSVYSRETDESTPLTIFSNKGAQTSGFEVAKHVFAQIANFSPDATEMPKLDRAKFGFDQEYREQIAKDYGIAIKHELRLDPTHLKEVDREMVADFVASKLIDTAFKAEASKVYYTKQDLENPDLEKSSLNTGGFINRVGIKTDDDKKLASEKREKDVQGIGSKYGFRGMTKQEKKDLSLLGKYSEFSSAADKMAEAKGKFLENLSPADFAKSTDSDAKETKLVEFLKKYDAALESNPKLDFHKFCKENSFVKVGKTSGALNVPDADRIRFREIEVQLKELVDLSKIAKKSETFSQERVDNFDLAATSLNPAFATNSAAESYQLKSEKGSGSFADAALRVVAGTDLDAINQVAGKLKSFLGRSEDQAISSAKTSYETQREDVSKSILHHHLLNSSIHLTQRGELLDNFVHAYHKTSKDKTGSELEQAAIKGVQSFLKPNNTELVKKVLGLAVSYSEMKTAEEQKIKEDSVVLASQANGAPAKKMSAKESLLADFQKEDLAKLGQVENGQIVMQGVSIASEGKKPMYLVLKVDPNTNQVSDIELHGGALKGTKALSGDDNRQLFDANGAMKSDHVDKMKIILQNYQTQKGLNEKLGEVALKAQGFEKPATILSTTALLAKKVMDLTREQGVKTGEGYARQ